MAYRYDARSECTLSCCGLSIAIERGAGGRRSGLCVGLEGEQPVVVAEPDALKVFAAARGKLRAHLCQPRCRGHTGLRGVSEALTSASQHAGATRVWVR